MRRWTIPLLGVLAAGAGAAASPSTLALWPQHLDAELSVSHAAGDQTIVEASHGGALGTFNTKIDAPSEVQLDPLIDAVDVGRWFDKVSWVPASDARSSVFDRFVANLPQFDRVHAEGIHLQVKLREGASWGDLNETHHERIETNVRGVLQSALPTLEIRPDLSRGFLARSFCDYRAWKTNNPMQETLREPTAGSSRLCYSSSFPLASKNESDSFFNRILDSPNSKVERGLAKAKRGFSFSFIRREHRFAMVTVGRSSVSSPTIEVEYLETWVAKKLDAESWRTVLRLGKLESSLFIVASVKQDADLYTIQYVQLQRESKLPQSLSVVNIQVPMMTATASVQTTIAGEGFHRRYVMDVKTMEHGTCAKYSEDKVLLVRIPVSNTAYLDLDEIRRMERFGELKLLSFTKHIEIERPSPVSAQHVVGLEFAVPATNQVHLEYPIHFRYQAPSENDLYRQAYVIAPDIFLFCRDAKRSAVRKPTQTRVDAASNFFQTWGLTGYADQVISSGDARWFRLATTSPLPVTEVLTPVGYLPSGGLVSSVTLLFASMGAALLLWVSAGVAKRTQMPSTASWKAKAE